MGCHHSSKVRDEHQVTALEHLTVKEIQDISEKIELPFVSQLSDRNEFLVGDPINITMAFRQFRSSKVI